LTRPVAAKDYWEKGRVRRYMARVYNMLLIDRREIKVHQSPVDLMIREIGDKYSLILFPEGHRNPEGEMGEFKSGLYYLGKKRPDMELLPVYVDNLNRVLPRGEFLPVPLLSCITFGPPIWLESKEPKAEFLKRAREAVRALKEV
jgi:1-acyl-sn-glycerol-3-phosphate acyltransferase